VILQGAELGVKRGSQAPAIGFQKRKEPPGKRRPFPQGE